MISFQKLRRLFLSISLSILLITITAFGFGLQNSWAATSFKEVISQPETQIAIMNQKQGNSQMVKDKEADRFKGETTKGMNDSIVNPNYQPGGKTGKLERQDTKNMRDIKTEAGESMDSYPTDTIKKD